MSGDGKLGDFLRSRREAVGPAEVGLRPGPRRRTPGLRRAELATLAGVSVDYLTQLEQGRDRHPSPQILAAIADALRLSPDDRVLLRNLSKEASGADLLCPGRIPPERGVTAGMAALLERMDAIPAVLVNRLGEALAHTTAYARLFGPTGLLDASPPSRTRFVLTDDRARAVFPDWDRVADQQVAALAAGSSRDDPELTHLVDELTVVAGRPFVQRWWAPPTLPARAGIDRLVHPEAGELRLAYQTLDTEGQQLITYLAADEQTSEVLEELVRPGRPGALRVVRDQR